MGDKSGERGEWVFEVMRVRGGYKGGERVNGAF
jgi:hypothetical protein